MEYRKKCSSFNNTYDMDKASSNHLDYHIHTNRILTDGMYVSADENIGIKNSMVICCIISIIILQPYTLDCII